VALIGNRILRRLGQLYVGLVLYGVSMAFMIKSSLGLDPWDVFHQGLAEATGLRFGWIVNIVGAAVLLLWIPLRQRPGIGTISNVVVIGLAVDAALAVLPAAGPLYAQAGFLVFGIVLNGVATGLYIGARLGPGPRDGLMTGFVTLRPGRSIRLVRTGIEVTVLAIGWLLGGTVGLGTILYAAAIGPLAHFFIPLLTIGQQDHEADASADWLARRAERRLHRPDADLAEVEDARGEHRVGAGLDRRWEMRHLAGSAAGDHRDVHHRPDRGDQLQVEPGLGAVRVHRVEQDLSRAQLGAPARPLDRIETGAAPAAVGCHLEAAGSPFRAPHVEREHQHLPAEPFGDLRDELRPGDRGGVHAHLVRAGAQQDIHVGHRTDAAADGERDEHGLGRAAHHVQHRPPPIGGGGHVEEGQLVGTGRVVCGGPLDRVASVAEVEEVDPFDHPASVNIEAGNHPYGHRHDTQPN
jgi:uncharacterized membrane protein YczE